MKRRGLLGTLVNSLSHCIDYFFDRKRGTETYSWLELDDLGIDDEKKKHAELYQPTHAAALRRLLRRMNIPAGKTLVDLGSGKGKVLLIASEFGFAEAKGVEISPVLCDIARRNCSIYKDRANVDTKFTIYESDAYDYKIEDDEDVLYMFNPFDAYVLRQVMRNLMASLERQGRKTWIIYRNAVHRDVIEEELDAVETTEYSFLGQDFVVYVAEPMPAVSRNSAATEGDEKVRNMS